MIDRYPTPDELLDQGDIIQGCSCVSVPCGLQAFHVRASAPSASARNSSIASGLSITLSTSTLRKVRNLSGLVIGSPNDSNTNSMRRRCSSVGLAARHAWRIGSAMSARCH